MSVCMLFSPTDHQTPLPTARQVAPSIRAIWYNNSMDTSSLGTPPSGHIDIRRLADGDAPALFVLAMAQGGDLDGFSWRKGLRSESDELSFIKWANSAEARGDAYCRLITLDATPCGCASLYKPHPGSFSTEHAPTLQMGYWVGRFARGHGIGSQAMLMLMAEAQAIFETGSTVGIRTRSLNAPSLACASRLGMSAIGEARPSMFDPSDVDLILRGSLSFKPALRPWAAKP